MRLVDVGSSGVVELVSKYGHTKRTWNGRHVELPLSVSSDHYRFNGEVFCVCEGEGTLFFRDYPRALSFINLDAQALDAYLMSLRLPSDLAQRALIKDFISVYEKNIAKGGLYLNPPFFEDMERELLHGG
ncbi:hypothetical protein [Helicobacter salomonis]|uniref:hypothetical protein n=1 Tax=Helicobacter salomonis TaxID=56878 RepID=UPI000CF17B3E|nr:hypothetical protein [Helicobacter salomonis]